MIKQYVTSIIYFTNKIHIFIDFMVISLIETVVPIYVPIRLFQKVPIKLL